MPSDRHWAAALAEHDAAVRGFLELCDRIGADEWQRAPAAGQWTPAAIALHLCQTYEMGADEERRSAGMRMKVSPGRARAVRALILPWIIATSRFPRVRAPREVAPDETESKAVTRQAAAERLRRASHGCGAAMHRIARDDPAFRFTHAYFGPLPPYRILRLLSAHTRHHTRQLARVMAAPS